MRLAVRSSLPGHPRLAGHQRIGRDVPIVICAASLAVFTGAARGEIPFEREPINYLTAPVHDPIARLQERLQARSVELRYDDRQGYLRSVLDLLNVPVSSQVLV